jgi:hypothetical protein
MIRPSGEAGTRVNNPANNDDTVRDNEPMHSNVNVHSSSGTGGVVHQERFTVTEDRPEIRQVTSTYKEHHPVEKELVKEVRYTGNEQERSGPTEHLGTQERVIQAAPRGGV